MAVNVHFWAKLEAVRRRGVKLVVIDPRRSRTATAADWHLSIRIGTDAALALGIVHILVRDGLADRDYLAANTLGFEQWERDVIPRFAPGRVADITGLAVGDIEKLAAMYGAAQRSFIRIGEGMTRLARGGQALRAVAALPAVTGAYGRRGGGALLLTASSMDFNFSHPAQAALRTGDRASGEPQPSRPRAPRDEGSAAQRPCSSPPTIRRSPVRTPARCARASRARTCSRSCTIPS